MNSHPDSSETNLKISVISHAYNEAQDIGSLVMHLPAGPWFCCAYYESSGKRIYAVREVLE
ncbi:MAG: hypothetical protein U9Q89_08135 [Thermodesulfobacteriota bacterium]|nr:hypothetical protein [Thermodesulfobacteriota bacterium]